MGADPTLERPLPVSAPVVGRITEEHLSDAEKSFPGIVALYQDLDDKPATFLQLVWIYECEIKASSQAGHAAA